MFYCLRTKIGEYVLLQTLLLTLNYLPHVPIKLNLFVHYKWSSCVIYLCILILYNNYIQLRYIIYILTSRFGYIWVVVQVIFLYGVNEFPVSNSFVTILLMRVDLCTSLLLDICSFTNIVFKFIFRVRVISFKAFYIESCSIVYKIITWKEKNIITCKLIIWT